MKTQNTIKAGNRVTHAVYGEGTVQSTNDRYTVIMFDGGMKRRFLNRELLSDAFSQAKESAWDEATIVHIGVRNLFERLDYDIAINQSNSVSIFSAPNGCGKTTIFKLLDFVFNPGFRTFNEIKLIPFDSFSCLLSNGCTLSLIKESIAPASRDDADKDRAQLKSEVVFSLLESEKDLVFAISDPDGNRRRVSLADVITDRKLPRANYASYWDEEYADMAYVSETVTNRIGGFFRQMEDLAEQNSCKLGLDFIVANRLQKEYTLPGAQVNRMRDGFESARLRSESAPKVDFLKIAGDEMTKNVQTWLREYNGLVEDAKNNLPLMYINSTDAADVTFEQFHARWSSYHRELEKFYELGILEPRKAVISPDELQDAFAQKTAFLLTYLDAFEGTLAPLQKNYGKVKLFADIFHKRNEITQKRIRFTPNGIEIYSGGKRIDADCLSSGEKNDFVMFYSLIFNTSPGGVVLIDEPEISLHIEWQEEYLDRLLEICEMNRLQAIVATHSPNIVNGHFNLFVDKR